MFGLYIYIYLNLRLTLYVCIYLGGRQAQATPVPVAAEGSASRREDSSGLVTHDKSSENLSGATGKKPTLMSSIR